VRIKEKPNTGEKKEKVGDRRIREDHPPVSQNEGSVRRRLADYEPGEGVGGGQQVEMSQSQLPKGHVHVSKRGLRDGWGDHVLGNGSV